MGQHTLAGRSAVSCPVDHIVVDCESMREPGDTPDDHRHIFRLGCARYFHLRNGECTRSDSLEFTKTGQFWKWVRSKQYAKRTLWIWAHNAAFDLTLLDFWHMCESEKALIKFMVQDSPPTIIRALYGPGSIMICDTMNYYPKSLSDLGKALGLEKLPMPGWNEPNEAWFRYCMRDVAICEKFVLYLCQFNLRHKLGQLKPTAAGSAWSAFMTRFSDCEIQVNESANIRESEAMAYYGGRVECRFVGNVFAGIDPFEPEIEPETQYPHLHLPQKVHRVDCNSLYPSVMKGHDYPVHYLDMSGRISLSAFRRLLSEYEAVAMVRITTKKHEYPKRDKDRVQYAVGTYSAVLAGPELRQALDSGEIDRVQWVQRYERGRPFDSFVDFFYQWKENESLKEADSGMAKVAKMFLNSLYGKFAQRIHSWMPGKKMGPMPWGTWYESDPETGKPVKWRSMAWYAEYQDRVKWWKHAFPAISAYVTSHGRVKMNAAKAIIGHKNYLYSDTDSFHVTDRGYANMEAAGMIHSHRLGAFRLEDSASQIVYRGQKDYVFGGKVVVSGVPSNFEDLGNGVYRVRKFDGLASIFERQGESLVRETTQIMSMQHVYEYGKINPDGWTEPKHIFESAPF